MTWTAIITQLVVLGCGETHGATPILSDPTRQVERDRMVDHQIMPRGIKDSAVIAAMRRVPRHRLQNASGRGIFGIPTGRSRMIRRRRSDTGTCSGVAATRSQTDCTESFCSRSGLACQLPVRAIFVRIRVEREARDRE